MNIKKSKIPYLVVFVLLCFVLSVWLFQLNRFVESINVVPVQKLPDYETAIPVLVEEIKSEPKIKKDSVKRKRRVPPKKETKKQKDIGQGNFVPNLLARYDMPVSDYIAFMKSRGAKVLVYDKISDCFICEILDNGMLMKSPCIRKEFVHLRRLTDDYPGKQEILAKVDKHFGGGSFEILLQIPDSLDRSFSKNISNMVNAKGLKMSDVFTVFMTYRGNATTLLVYIEKVAGNFGTRKIGRYFKL